MARHGTCDVIGLSSSASSCFIPSVMAAFRACSLEQRVCADFVWGFFAVLMHEFALLTDKLGNPEHHTSGDFADVIMATVNAAIRRGKWCRACLLNMSLPPRFRYDTPRCATCGHTKGHRAIGWDSPKKSLKEGIAAGLMVIYRQFLEPHLLEDPLYPMYRPGDKNMMCDCSIRPYRGCYRYDIFDGDMLSVRMTDESESVLSCTFHRDKNIHQIGFTRTIAGVTEIIGMMRVNIRAGVCPDSCILRFWGKPKCDLYENIVTWRSEDDGTLFPVAGCWTILKYIASCLDAGGRIVSRPSGLECVDRCDDPVMSIGVYVNSSHDDMAGVISGYTEAWITTATATGQSNSITVIEPVRCGFLRFPSSNAVTRHYVHREVAKMRTALIN